MASNASAATFRVAFAASAARASWKPRVVVTAPAPAPPTARSTRAAHATAASSVERSPYPDDATALAAAAAARPASRSDFVNGRASTRFANAGSAFSATATRHAGFLMEPPGTAATNDAKACTAAASGL